MRKSALLSPALAEKEQTSVPIPSLEPSGLLPLGRYMATADEIVTRFVDGLHPVRAEIWGEWQQLNLAMKHAVPSVAAMWVSGSFFTDRAEPGDLDCLYIVDWAVLAASKSDAGRALFLERVAKSQVKTAYKVRVDSFILDWFPSPGPSIPGYARPYLESRGYWDDLWSRERSSDKRLDSVPRRGYLEVIVDGYS